MIVNLLLVHILSYVKPITTLQPYIFKIQSSIILPPTLCSTWSVFWEEGLWIFPLPFSTSSTYLPSQNTWISSSQIMKLIMQFYVVSTTFKYSHQLPIHKIPSIQPLIQEITFHAHKGSRQYYSSVYFSLCVFSWKMGMSSSTVNIYWDFRGIYCLHPQGSRPEDGNRSFHQKSKFLTGYKVSHPLK